MQPRQVEETKKNMAKYIANYEHALLQCTLDLLELCLFSDVTITEKNNEFQDMFSYVTITEKKQ